MNHKKSGKPSRRVTATAYRTVPIEDETAGKLFRVRCKDWENLWGENLPWKDANTLKEQIATRGKSKTVRVEDMEIPAPDWYLEQENVDLITPPVATGKPDKQLETLRGKAVAAVKETAQAAQQRHNLAAARDRSSGAVAPQAKRPVPVVKTEAPSNDQEPDIDASDLSDLMATSGASPSDSDVSRARAESNREIAELDAKAKALYEQASAKLDPPVGGHAPWEKLGKASQAGWKFTASDPNVPDPRFPVDQISDDPTDYDGQQTSST